MPNADNFAKNSLLDKFFVLNAVLYFSIEIIRNSFLIYRDCEKLRDQKLKGQKPEGQLFIQGLA